MYKYADAGSAWHRRDMGNVIMHDWLENLDSQYIAARTILRPASSSFNHWSGTIAERQPVWQENEYSLCTFGRSLRVKTTAYSYRQSLRKVYFFRNLIRT